MTFKRWLSKFEGVDLPIGDVANDVSQDGSFPETNDYEKILEHLKNRGAVDKVLAVFEESWNFYSESLGILK